MRSISGMQRLGTVAIALSLFSLVGLPSTNRAAAASASAPNNLNILPLVVTQVGATPPPVNVVEGRRFFAKAVGFQAGETVRFTSPLTLYAGNVLTETKTAVAGSDGSTAGVVMTVPNGAKQGIQLVFSRGETSKKQAKARIRVLYRPKLALVSANIRPRQAAQVSGTGFVPRSKIRVALVLPRQNQPTQTLSRDVRADAAGTFIASITVPPSTHAGVYTITALDLDRGFQAKTSLTISVKPSISSLSPSPISPGRRFTVSGVGFAAGVAIKVHVTFPLYRSGTKYVSGLASSNSKGEFSLRLRVPDNAASGKVTVFAVGPTAQASSVLEVKRVAAAISLSAMSAIPGQTITVTGFGYPAGDRVDVTVQISLTDGSSPVLRTTATANGSGQFSAALRIPPNAAGGTFTLVARSEASGRAPSARLSVSRLAPSIVALPTAAVPGTQITVHGLGFAAGVTARIYLNGREVGSTRTNGSGQFTVNVTVPGDTASGNFPLTASAGNGQKSTVALAVHRHVSTHFYFPSEYTGSRYSNYLTFSNLTATRAQVTITYQLKNGSTQIKRVATSPHTRYTENVNTDLGAGVSASAEVAADVPISAEAVVYKGSDGAVEPGSTAPSTVWYFANGNTSHGYREYIAVQNPNSGPVQVAVRFLPTHHKPFTIYRNMGPTSRTTFKVGSFVKDAVGVTLTSNGPVVANRSIFIKHGITSKNGAVSPHRSWYFAGGPQDGSSKHWIAAINPSSQTAYVTVTAYGPSGGVLGTKSSYLGPYARVGYLINTIAARTDAAVDAAVVVTASGPIVAEQTTYQGSMHDASTDSFGVSVPAKTSAFTVVNTSSPRGETDGLDLFNPNSVPIPIVVQFISSSSKVLERTYVVYPLFHQHVDVASVMPNSQLALVAASNYPFVPLNRYVFNHGLGADTSTGIQG